LKDLLHFHQHPRKLKKYPTGIQHIRITAGAIERSELSPAKIFDQSIDRAAPIFIHKHQGEKLASKIFLHP
jgi:hypothetical protein